MGSASLQQGAFAPTTQADDSQIPQTVSEAEEEEAKREEDEDLEIPAFLRSNR